MNFRQIIFIACTAFCFAAFADDRLTMSMTAYEQGDYQQAYEQFTLLAQQDNSEAQYNLAFMYFGGDGIAQDDVKAVFWFEKAAKLAHAGAQDTLAYMHLNGRGLDASLVEAYAWYRVAAENGIFLAKNVSENLKKQMNVDERLHADLLSSEYIKEYKKE